MNQMVKIMQLFMMLIVGMALLMQGEVDAQLAPQTCPPRDGYICYWYGACICEPIDGGEHEYME